MSNVNNRKWAFPRGLAKRTNQTVIDTQKLFDFERAVKEVLNKYGVPYTNVCDECPAPTVVGLTGEIGTVDGTYTVVNGIITEFTEAP